jgi:PqqA peptide cyclase
MNAPANIPRPVGLLAELTHRCPLGCPYCSNPLELESRAEELDTATWQRVFSEAAELGIIHIHLSGGEPASRRDLTEIVAHCAKAGLYTNLITSGIGLNEERVAELSRAGLDHVQLSIQDSEAESADRIAGYEGAYARKRDVARSVNEAGLPLTVNAVIHRANVARASAMVKLAIELGAKRVEIAHTQYYGWAKINRAALLPSRADAERAIAEVEALREEHKRVIVIDHVIPDYHAHYPKACMGGWARRTLNVTPTGKVLPCHAAETIPGLEFWSVREHALADIWYASPAFQAFRAPVRARRSISAAAAVRRWRSPAMRATPIRSAISRRIITASRRSSARIRQRRRPIMFTGACSARRRWSRRSITRDENTERAARLAWFDCNTGINSRD